MHLTPIEVEANPINVEATPTDVQGSRVVMEDEYGDMGIKDEVVGVQVTPTRVEDDVANVQFQMEIRVRTFLKF